MAAVSAGVIIKVDYPRLLAFKRTNRKSILQLTNWSKVRKQNRSVRLFAKKNAQRFTGNADLLSLIHYAKIISLTEISLYL